VPGPLQQAPKDGQEWQGDVAGVGGAGPYIAQETQRFQAFLKLKIKIKNYSFALDKDSLA
jgi:hypothetical protein